MRILLTNHSLAHRTGTELFLVELAEGLLQRGHQPVLYSPELGGLANEARARGLAVIDDLELTGPSAEPFSEPFDVIHAQHWMETLAASLRFPDVPVVVMVHGHDPWQERVAALPTVRAWVTVTEANVGKVAREAGVARGRVEVVLNGVDLRRFRPRGPLPVQPQRALVFSNLAQEASYLPVVRDACGRFGVALDVAGLASGAVASQPENLLSAYDLVFAKGRAALEALAVGCAVVVCDALGSGPLVDRQNFARLRSLNFGRFAFDGEVSVERLEREIARYDARAARVLSEELRAEIDFELAVDRLEAIHRRAIDDHRRDGPIDAADLLHAASAQILAIDPLLRERERLQDEVRHRWREEEALRAVVRDKDAELERSRLDAARTALELEAVHRLARDSDQVLRGRWWRLRESLLRQTWLRAVYRWVLRLRSAC